MAIGGSALLGFFLVAATYGAGGGGLAARTATDLAMPVGLMWLLCFGGIVAGFRMRNFIFTAFFLVSFLFIGVLFNSQVARWCMQSLEMSVTSDPVQALEQPLDAVVLLGGYIGVNRFGVAELGCSGQRLVLAAQMWHSGTTKKIICTGTGSPGFADQSTLGKQMLISLGVAESQVFEVGGENTIAEMTALKELLGDPDGIFGRRAHGAKDAGNDPVVGLVTSAFHMPRAMRLAKSAGLELQPIACSFQGSGEGNFTARDLVPRADAGKSFALGFKEYLARLVGR